MAAGAGARPGGRSIPTTAATSAGREVTTPTTAPRGEAVEKGEGAVGAGRLISHLFIVIVHTVLCRSHCLS